MWWVGVIALVKGKVFSLMDDGWMYVKVLRGFGRQCGHGEADEGRAQDVGYSDLGHGGIAFVQVNVSCLASRLDAASGMYFKRLVLQQVGPNC
ncbi:hypothetical protein XFFB_08080 [Xylella fastidiosa]|nr:hypothetical protein XFFB_08080 [Xylella fastidiosa]